MRRRAKPLDSGLPKAFFRSLLDDKNTTVNVAPTVKTGGWVSVVEKTDNNGHKTVTVKPSSQKRAKTTS